MPRKTISAHNASPAYLAKNGGKPIASDLDAKPEQMTIAIRRA
jgi:hypothetical protein